MDLNPSKEDIEAVFHRLRAIPTNKVCFDCNAKNPTWSSVTYGIFICLDCSAVHRSLGVHLTFVRSTQLDTNWTWVQLRQMQLGGNANAMQFFSQHNCNTTDAQKKYNSRAAQLYKEKLQQIALNSLKTNKELHIHAHTTEEKESPKEVDFFAENEQFYVKDAPEQLFSNSTVKSVKNDPTEGPTVNLSQNHDAEPRKSTISARKPAAKKVGLGAKKGGLGATRVKTNFADLEKEASMAEEMKLKMAEEEAKEILVSAKNAEERDAAVRLAYKDISTQQQKAEEQMRKQDPKKAEQVERLGMGFGTRSGVSHSAMSDMRVIEQENVQSKNSTLSSLGKLRLSEDNFFDDFYSNSSKNDKSSSKDDETWVITDDPFEKYRNKNTYPSPVSSDKPKEKHRSVPSVSVPSGEESAQKKFGNAKAISSDQYFNNQTLDYETQTNLNRFQGSSSISSSEFFGNGQPEKRGISSSVGNSLQYYDVEDVKESVRQGVTKVAGKISSLANGVMSSIQDRYGY